MRAFKPNAADFLVTWHTDAMEASDLIQTCSVILAWVGHAFVYVQFTSSSHISLQTFTLEGTFCVYTLSSMFARVCT